MKKFRKVLDGLTTSSPGGTIGSPSCGSAAGTPTAVPTPKEIDIQETLVSENFQLCKVGRDKRFTETTNIRQQKGSSHHVAQHLREPRQHAPRVWRMEKGVRKVEFGVRVATA